jgi:hypothetical protein
MALRTYDPKQVAIIFGGPITGFADGTFVSIEANEEFFALIVGSDGEACRSKTNNYSARITLTLGQWSASNQVLSAQLQVDLNSPLGDGIIPFLLKDGSGSTVMSAEKAWIVQFATVEYGREPAAREWVIETDYMIPNIGGNL